MLHRLYVRARMHASLVVFVAASSTPVLAHGDHGGGGGTVLPAGITVVSFDVDYTRYKPISDARLAALSDQGVDGVHSLKQIAVPAISIGYGVTNDLTVGVRLPYLANRDIRETDTANGGFTERGGVYGFGDTTVTATYRVVREAQSGFEAALTAGVKIPTGRSDAQDKFGVLFETEHQPGSGSWDGVFGLNLSKQSGLWGFNGSALYGLAGDGDQNTRLGDHFSYGIGVSYRIQGGSGAEHMHLGGTRPDGIMHHGGHDHAAEDHLAPNAVDLTLGLNGEWHDRQRIAGLRDDNTGGHTLYVTPGVRFATERTTTSVNVGIPVATDLNGIQSAPDWRLTTSMGVKF